MTSNAHSPTATVIRLHGDIDIFSSETLRQRLLTALSTCESTLICDLSDISFIDTSGLGVLMGIRRRAKAMGIVLALTAPTGYTSELLHVTGLDRSLPIYQRGQVDAALRS
ncbi:STAS domain-containing protein [Nonomuraea sp. NPDC002799]